jgi:sec-independent protein translocase protein TatB
MFDIGFSELLIIAVVALIVIGPQQLPKVARTLGHLFGRMQRYVNDVKADITREMELEELKKMRTSMEDAARSFQTSVDKEVSSTESELNKMARDAQSAVDGFGDTPPPPPPAAEEPAPEAKPQPPAPKQA